GHNRKAHLSSKSKGKRRATSADLDNSDGERAPIRGRPSGSSNYSAQELTLLLDLVEDRCPIGKKAWGAIAKDFNNKVRGLGRPERQEKALENKFKQLVKTKKPTGDARRPPEVLRALKIDDLINARAGTRDLSDSDVELIPGGSIDSSDSDIEVDDGPRIAIARRNPSPPLQRKPRASNTDLMHKLASAFDPDRQRTRDEAKAQRAFEATQLFTLTQQNDTLRNQNMQLLGKVSELERKVDRAELKLEFGMAHSARSDPHRLLRDDPHDLTGLQRVRGKIRSEQTYPDGGAMTNWVTDISDSDA
ncbi:hypothetical protein GGX14DRAFT_331331, partial [Mycena pura]